MNEWVNESFLARLASNCAIVWISSKGPLHEDKGQFLCDLFVSFVD